MVPGRGDVLAVLQEKLAGWPACSATCSSAQTSRLNSVPALLVPTAAPDNTTATTPPAVFITATNPCPGVNKTAQISYMWVRLLNLSHAVLCCAIHAALRCAMSASLSGLDHKLHLRTNRLHASASKTVTCSRCAAQL